MKSYNKKIFLYAVAVMSCFFCLYTLTSCNKGNEQESNKEQVSFDIREASNFVEAYMNSIDKGNIENIKKFYSKKLVKDAFMENKEFKVVGYNIIETSKVGDTGLFRIRIARTSTTKPIASLDEYTVKVAKEGADYKIQDTKNSEIKEAFQEVNQIRIKSKQNVNTNLLLDMDSIPNYSFCKDDKANMQKITVPKKGFGTMAFSYNGDMLIITTTDIDSFIAYAKIDETLEVQGGAEENGGGGGTKSSTKGQNNAREKPIGKELIALDLIKDSKINYLRFSKDEKYIAVEYNKTNLGKSIRVYKTEGGDIIDFKFEDKFPMDKLDLSFSSFDKENINFDVTARSSSDKSTNELIGKWQLNLKELKAKKI